MIGLSSRVSLGAALILLFAGCQPTAETAAPETVKRPSQTYSIEDFLDTSSVAGASFSPDTSKMLVSSDETGVWNVYALSIDGEGREQLTSSEKESIFAIGYFPEDERFLYASDQGGNELNHVYVRELDGSVVDLTPGEGLRATFGGWARDYRSFFIGTNERDQRYVDFYEYQLEEGYPRELIYQNEDGLNFAGISPDKKTLALSKINHNADSDIFLYDRATQETTHITPHEGSVSNSPMGFTPDGSAMLFGTDEGSEFSYVVRYDLESGERSTLIEADWDVSFASYSNDGTYLVASINNDARSEVRLYDGNTMERQPLPELPNAEVRGLIFSRDESMMAYYASSPRQPSDLYVQPVGGEAVRLTRSLSEKIDPEDLVAAEVVRFNSFDGLEIPGVLYTPHQAREEGAKLPAMVWVHGGPGGQSRVGYSALIQYMVNNGYVVYAINNRGSSGYGKTFLSLDDRNHGKGDLQDCIKAKDMLVETGYVDPERIGIIGGSYGGFMVLAALAFEPESFDVGVDIFGVSNWVRTTQSIPPWWEAVRDALEREIGDFDDIEYLRSISPLFHADNIVRPLMVLQGANDPRVLQAESDDIVEAARANGTPVEYLVFEDEGHGFRKKENQEEGYAAIVAFLDQYLKGESPEDAGSPDAADAA
ncbi:MAG: S9 family peptidase [Acidobacteriota bacterium]